MDGCGRIGGQFGEVGGGIRTSGVVRSAGGAGLLGEFVEEGVFSVVGEPDSEVAGPRDAGLGGLPEEFRIGVFGKFVEPDVAAIDRHGVGIGGESYDAGAVLEFDVADFDFYSERSGVAFGIEGFDFDDVFPVAENGAGVTKHIGEVVNLVHVFERAGPVFRHEEVVAILKAEAFADIFETVAKGPADTDGFFGEGKDLFFCFVERVFGLDPADLVVGEVIGQEGGGVDFGKRKDGGHGSGKD